jgi:plasmanylethanolamine desaturase
MSEPSPSPNASLAQYTRTARAVDTLGVLGFFTAVGANLWRLAHLGSEALDAVSAGALLAGYVAADIGSGTLHWFFDTWLSAKTPVLGSMFVRPFREHHVDPLAITRHDFTETNGSNCLATLPLLLLALALDPRAGPRSQAGVVFLVALSLGVFATNQFHSWAHQTDCPAWIRWIQRSGLALRPEHHAVHHQAPHTRHYCITTGWMNAPLDRVGYFRSLERVISAVTGVPPRLEDGAITRPPPPGSEARPPDSRPA